LPDEINYLNVIFSDYSGLKFEFIANVKMKIIINKKLLAYITIILLRFSY